MGFRHWLTRSMMISAALSLAACGSEVLEQDRSAGGAANGGGGGTRDASGGAEPGGAGPTGAAETGGTGNTGGDAGGEGGHGEGGVGAHAVGQWVCGDTLCSASEQCLICAPEAPDAEGKCVEEFTGTCDAWGELYPALYMSCDGHEDCGQGARCILMEGSLGTYTQCWSCEEDDCAEVCESQWPGLTCRTLADCPACATGCSPYQPGYPVSVCTF